MRKNSGFVILSEAKNPSFIWAKESFLGRRGNLRMTKYLVFPQPV
jgi:hypothetical protein